MFCGYIRVHQVQPRKILLWLRNFTQVDLLPYVSVKVLNKIFLLQMLNFAICHKVAFLDRWLLHQWSGKTNMFVSSKRKIVCLTMRGYVRTHVCWRCRFHSRASKEYVSFLATTNFLFQTMHLIMVFWFIDKIPDDLASELAEAEFKDNVSFAKGSSVLNKQRTKVEHVPAGLPKRLRRGVNIAPIWRA